MTYVMTWIEEIEVPVETICSCYPRQVHLHYSVAIDRTWTSLCHPPQKNRQRKWRQTEKKIILQALLDRVTYVWLLILGARCGSGSNP